MTDDVGQRLFDDPGRHPRPRRPGSPDSSDIARAVAGLILDFNLDRDAGATSPANSTGESVLQVGFDDAAIATGASGLLAQHGQHAPQPVGRLA